MHACRVACCPLVSHFGYIDRRDRQTDRQTDGRQTITLRFPLDAAGVIINLKIVRWSVINAVRFDYFQAMSVTMTTIVLCTSSAASKSLSNTSHFRQVPYSAASEADVQRVSKKLFTWLLTITSASVDWFSIFFHWQIFWEKLHATATGWSTAS